MHIRVDNKIINTSNFDYIEFGVSKASQSYVINAVKIIDKDKTHRVLLFSSQYKHLTIMKFTEIEEKLK